MILSALLYVSCYTKDIYDNIKDFSVAEIIYPAHFDTIYGQVGLNYVEIDLCKAGRVPAAKMNLGKAVRTIIEYTGHDPIVIDSLCSWVKITGLTQPNLYRFIIYTTDEFDDRSTPVEIALTPYTDEDLAVLSVAPPRVTSSPWAATLTWPSASSVLYDCYGFTFSYTDKDNNLITGKSDVSNTLAYVENLEPGLPDTIYMTFTIVPKVNNVVILDTIVIERNIILYMPTTEDYQKKLKNREIQSMLIAGGKMKIRWGEVDETTLKYTTLKYMDYSNDPENPVEKTLVIENTEMVTEIEGMRYGIPYTLTSTYEPIGAAGTLIDAIPAVLVPPGPKKTFPLELTTSGMQRMSFTVVDDYFILVSTGADPYIYTTGIPEYVRNEPMILTFEYKCSVDFTWEFFYSTPNADGAKMQTSFSPRANDWTEYTYEITDWAKQYGWGSEGHRFRFDPSNNAGITLYIKNIKVVTF
jgi:hypothetical protein